SAPPSASRPINPISGSSLAVFGRLPDVPTGRSLSVAEGGDTDGLAGAAVAGGCSGVGLAAGCGGGGGLARSAVVGGGCGAVVGGGGVDAVDCDSAAVTREMLPVFQSSIDVPALSTAITGSPDACAIVMACAFGYTSSLPSFSPA